MAVDVLIDDAGHLIEAAKHGPKCFRCGELITEFDQVRIVTVRVNDEPLPVWMHADRAKPSELWVPERPEGMASCVVIDGRSAQ
jgi:hypothetical protein